MVDRGRVKLPLAACKAAVLIVITIGPLKFILKHYLLHYKQTRQRYLCLLSSTNLPFGWWTLTDRRPTSSLMELLFPELKAHYRLMLDSKTLLRISASWTRTSDGLAAGRLTVCSLLPTRVLPNKLSINEILCFLYPQFWIIVPRLRLELRTPCLRGTWSNQLS